MSEENQTIRSAFISYASPDLNKAEEICESLESRGFQCWIAPRNVRAGREYGEEIILGIESSRCLVLVLSESANESIYVRREVERAVSKRLPVFPVRIEEVMPSPGLELFVSTTHWIDAWSGPVSEHIDHLASELSDDSLESLKPPRTSGFRIPRKLRKWIGSAAAVLVIAAVVAIVNSFTQKSAVPPEIVFPAGMATSIDDAFGKKIKATGVDPKDLTEKDIKLIPVADYSRRIGFQVKRSPDMEKLNGYVAGLYLALDDGNFSMVGRGGTDSISYRDLDQSTLLNASKIRIRCDLLNGQKIGPFVYPLDITSTVVNSASSNSNTPSSIVSLRDRATLNVRYFSIDFRDLPSDIVSLKTGYEKDKLNREIDITGIGEAQRRTKAANIPCLDNIEVFMQWGSKSGKTYPVEAIPPPSNSSNINHVVGTNVPPTGGTGPELYVFPDREVIKFRPDLWLNAKRVRFSFDENVGFDAEKIGYPKNSRFGHYFKFEGPLSSKQIRLDVDWSDGRESSVFFYQLENTNTIFVKEAKSRFEMAKKDFSAVRFKFFESKKTPEFVDPEAVPRRDRAAHIMKSGADARKANSESRQVIIDEDIGYVPTEPGLYATPYDFDLHGVKLRDWIAVSEIRYGVEPGKLIHTQVVNYTPEEIKQNTKKEPEEVFLIKLPVETQAFYYSLDFRDGTASPEQRKPILELTIPR